MAAAELARAIARLQAMPADTRLLQVLALVERLDRARWPAGQLAPVIDEIETAVGQLCGGTYLHQAHQRALRALNSLPPAPASQLPEGF